MRFSWRYVFLMGILIQSDAVLAMKSVFREDIEQVIPTYANKVVSKKDQAYFRALTTVFADAYKQERDIFREERRLHNSMQRRDKEIFDEIDDIMGDCVIFPGFSSHASEKRLERLSYLSQEKSRRRAYVEQVLMSRLSPKQQLAVQEYVRKRDEFWTRKEFADRAGGIPFYELDSTVFIPYYHRREQSDVCSYLMENRLRGLSPSCKLERAAAAHCPEALALLGYEEMAARFGHKQLCLKQANFCFEKLMDEFFGGEVDLKNSFSAFYWYQKILRQPIRYINTDGDLKIPQNAGALLPIPESEKICYAQAACNLGILCMLKVGVPREFANNTQARRYFRWAASFDYEPAVWKLIYFEFSQKHVPPCNLGRCNALFLQSLMLVNKYLKDHTCENKLALQRACCVLSECVKQFEIFMPFTTTYFDKVKKLIMKVEQSAGSPEKTVIDQFTRLIRQLLLVETKRALEKRSKSITLETSVSTKSPEVPEVSCPVPDEASCSRSVEVSCPVPDEASCSRSVEVSCPMPDEASCSRSVGVNEKKSPYPNARYEGMPLLEQKAECLFDVNFQHEVHTSSAYLKKDKNTMSAISACYSIAGKLVRSDSLKAARMFMAAESTVAFLYKKYKNKDIAYLPEGINASNILHAIVREREDINLLAALIFSVSCRYSDGILHDASLDNLASLSKRFLVSANTYFKNGDHSNKQQVLLMCLACNAYCILGCKLKIQESILIDLMRGVVSIAPKEYWFFRYNLESILAGCQDEGVESLKPYSKNLLSIQNDCLLKSMIITGYQRPTFFSWCGIL